MATLATSELNPFPPTGLNPNLAGRKVWDWQDSKSELSQTPERMNSPSPILPPLQFGNQISLPLRSMPSVPLRSPPLPTMQHGAYDDQRLFSLARPRTNAEPVELPSIRTAVPEINTRGIREPYYRTDSPRQQSPFDPRIPFADYNVSDSVNKRRKTTPSDEYDSDPRDSFPRYEPEPRESIHRRRSRSPSRYGQRTYGSSGSPSSSIRRGSVQSTTGSRNGSNRTSPYTQARVLPSIQSPSMETMGFPQPQEWRPTLPNLPALPARPLDSGPPPFLSRRASTIGEYSYDPSRSGAQTYPPPSNGYEPPTSQLTNEYFNFHPRGQSYSGPSGRERTPFSANHHQYSNSSNYPYGMELQDSGNEGKQRKRRGNLPKETTDKLRSWFVAHVTHPYPTEDEKQDLMKQTGLQMNQISNWFINARRRQLPTMMSNARAEADAMAARTREAPNQVRRTPDYSHPRGSNGTTPDSDVGSGYDEDYRDGQRPRY